MPVVCKKTVSEGEEEQRWDGTGEREAIRVRVLDFKPMGNEKTKGL